MRNMYTAEVSVDIAAPPERVYDYLSDLSRHAEWSSSVTTIEQLTPGPAGVGTEFKASEIIPTKITSFARITALEPPRRIGWEATDHRVFKTQWEFELSPSGGGTHLIQRVRFQALNLPAVLLLNWVRRPKVSTENRQSLERIKTILEAQARGSSYQ